MCQKAASTPGKFSNQYCKSAFVLESKLRDLVVKIVLQHNLPTAAVSLRQFGRVVGRGERNVCPYFPERLFILSKRKLIVEGITIAAYCADRIGLPPSVYCRTQTSN